MVLENLDAIDGPAIAPLLMRLSAAGTGGLVVTGGRRLRTLLGHSVTETGLSFRLFPLSVLLDGETCRLIGRDTNPSLAAWTGSHPYVTKSFLPTISTIVKTVITQSRPAGASGSHWCGFWLRTSEKALERRLLCYLIERGKPVNPARLNPIPVSKTLRRSRRRLSTWVSSAAGSGMKRRHSSPGADCSIITSLLYELQEKASP